MIKKYFLVIDESTTRAKAFVFDRGFRIIAQDSCEIKLFVDENNYIEQDGNEIYSACIVAMKSALNNGGVLPEEIIGIGITNQRGTSLAWDKTTGEPLGRAISWQDTRASGIGKKIESDGWIKKIQERMILPAGTLPLLNLFWLLNNNDLINQKYQQGELMYGTIDSWLIYKLTEGRKYFTSYSNVSMFHGYDFVNMSWDEDYLRYLGISSAILPEVVHDVGLFGLTGKGIFGVEIPIMGAFADQQSATFAHRTIQAGMVKCTCGTGAFVDMCVGNHFKPAPVGMFPIAAYITKNDCVFLVEGCIKTAGAIIEWLKDDIQLINDYNEIQTLAGSVPDSAGVYFIPALTGLGSPSWNSQISGSLTGLKRSTKKSHIIRALLEGVVFRIKEICEIIQDQCATSIQLMRIDGGLSKSDVFCQLVADSLGILVERSHLSEETALGVAELIALHFGYCSESELDALINMSDKFYPRVEEITRMENLYNNWKKISNSQIQSEASTK